jgi:hypothetical protein
MDAHDNCPSIDRAQPGKDAATARSTAAAASADIISGQAPWGMKGLRGHAGAAWSTGPAPDRLAAGAASRVIG